ncbi:MAG: uncharacterized protein JWN40_934 [Phycisphaerales bacterium]|nr:uncharacterized protein [Phycisphaerales bacterium]
MNLLRLAIRVLLAIVLGIGFINSAGAQTWTGNSNGLWNVGSNWTSNPSVPVSGVDTSLNFGAAGAGGTSLTQNLLPNPFLLNALIFTKSAPTYTISGNGLDFRTSSVAVAPQIVQNSATAITLVNPLTLTNNVTIAGTGIGALNLNGAVLGAGSLTINAVGPVLLGNSGNAFSSLTIASGSLTLGNGAAIPAGRNVTIQSGGRFSTGGLSNTAATAIGAVSISDGGTFQVPSGSGNYFINRLAMDSPGFGQSMLDFTGAATATLHLVNPGAGISISGDGAWIGGGNSRLVNDTATPIDISLATFGTLTSSLRLANGANGQGFRVTGAGTTFTVTNAGNSANLNVDNAANLSVAEFIGTGTLTLSDTSVQQTTGTLLYTGGTASSTKAITLGSGGGQVQVGAAGTNLTLSGVISESSAGQRLLLAGTGDQVPATLTLTGNNTYTGLTQIGAGLVVSVAAIPNGGIAGPFGAASISSGGNFVALSGFLNGAIATLQYTGATASTDRGIALTGAGAIEVTNAQSSLTLAGQVIDAFLNSGALVKNGPGTLILGNSTNAFSGGAVVNAGRLMLGSGTAMPAGANVVVQSGAEFNTAGFANAKASAIATLVLNGGTLRVPSGTFNNSYHLNKLVTDFSGGTVDLTGTTNGSSGGFALLFDTTGAAININGNTSWMGPGTSFIANNIGGGVELPITIAPNATLTSTVGLASFSPSASFPIRVTGGGTLYLNGGVVFAATIRVNQAKLRLDTLTGLNSSVLALTLDAATLQYGGASSTGGSAFSLGSGGGTIEVLNPSTILTLFGAIPGSDTAPLTKIGPGTLALTNTSNNTYQGGLIVSGGRLDVSADAQLGQVSPTVNPAGTLRFTASTTTARTFSLNGGALEAASGATLNLNGAAVNGGFMRGAGVFALTGGTAISGANTASSATLNQIGPASVNNFTNNGQFTNAAGQTLTWNNGTNTSAGRMTVMGTANVNDLVSDGTLTIAAGGTLNNGGSPMVLGGGSTTFIGSAAAPGGTVNLGGQSLEVRGGLLVNNGTINGTVNVHFNGQASGAGTFGPVNLFENGRFAPGASASPAVFSPAAVAASQASFATGTSLAIEIGGKTAGSGFDQVNVTGAAALAGTLEVTTANNFIPAALDAFKIASFASRSGAFTTYQGMTSGNGFAYAPIYSGTDLTLIATLPGDANLDGRVDFLDLAKLAQSYNSTVSGITDSWWLNGDFTYDGTVDFLDLAKLAQNYNTSALPAAPGEFSAAFAADWTKAQELASVPEPESIALMGVAILLMRIRRKRIPND